MRTTLVFGLLVGCAGGDPPKGPAEEPPVFYPDEGTGWRPVDADGDGYAASVDCDDFSPRVHPGATERCNGTDEGCDGLEDEADHDGDTWRLCEGDCDDADPSINPGEDEVWYDGVDQDCDGRDDDQDEDGVAGAEDCDDLDATAFPGAEELCDGRDNACAGAVPADEHDDDGDTQRICEGDCDDTSLWTFTGGVELCGDGRDNDCDGTVDLDCARCDAFVPGDFPSLQAAIDGAAAGAVVCAAGNRTYAENLDFGGAALTLWGVHGAARTVVDGGGAAVGAPVVQFVAAEGPDTVLRGFTLTNGVTSGYGGAGIRVVGASPTLADLIVTGNTWGSDGGGGGVWLEGGAPTLVDSVVTENVARFGESGGGIHVEEADVVLQNVLVGDNEGDRTGCGMYVENGSATLFQVSLISNGYGCSDGGGLYAFDATVAMTNVLVAENEADGYGGGLALTQSSARLDNVIVRDNFVGYWAAFGGGLHAYASSLVLTNVVIARNGVYAFDYRTYGGGLYASDTDLVLTNVIVTGNWAEWDRYQPGSAGGIYLRGTSTAVVRYSDVWANDPTDLKGMDDPTGTDGNLAVDPAFADDALHLSATSPLIDAGDPTILDPDGSGSDIGAYGGAFAARWDLDGDGWAAWWLPGAYDAATSPDLDCDDDDATVYPGSGCP